MRWSVAFVGAVLVAGLLGKPVAAAEEGIHLVLGPVDDHGCQTLQVWNGAEQVAEIAGFVVVGCASNLGSASLPNDTLVFDWVAASECMIGATSQIWATDGTSGGTFLVRQYSCGRAGTSWEVLGQTVFITRVETERIGNQIVATRGTPETTFPLPGASPGPTRWGQLYATLGERIFYGAVHALKGRELWVSDGSLAGSHLVRDIRKGPQGSDPTRLEVSHGLLRFTANDGTGRAWWISDGTRKGTHRVD